MYDCKNCGKSFTRKEHLKKHHNRKFKCSENIDHNIDYLKNPAVSQGPKWPKTVPAISQGFLGKIWVTEADFEEKSEKYVADLEKNIFSDKKAENKKPQNECEYCGLQFTRSDNLKAHIKKSCKMREKNLLENILVKVKDIEDKITTPHITNNTHNTHNNIQINNTILNFSDLNYDIDKTFMYKCLKDGLPGDIEYLRHVYLDAIPYDCRPVRCLDPSRDKCIVRKNGEWIASTGKDIYRQSLKRLVDNYLRINNSMLEECDIEKNNTYKKDDIADDILDDRSDDTSNNDITDNDFNDINEYLNEYTIDENQNTSNNIKMDEYVHNLNRITQMMDDKNVNKLRRQMNILLK